MVYTAAQKRRDTKNKWKRRIEMLKRQENEISLLLERFQHDRDLDSDAYIVPRGRLLLMLRGYGEVIEGYKWMREYLSGG
ncbi:MAG: hypothetical protein ABSB40_12885 [Nitrososphaeria archaeon]|jgi:hypothetical protein